MHTYNEYGIITKSANGAVFFRIDCRYLTDMIIREINTRLFSDDSFLAV
jgi:hypothetical protein